MRTHDKICIISFGMSTTPKLAFKLRKHRAPIYYIQLQFDQNHQILPISEINKKKLELLTGNSKIYIEGHGTNDLPHMISDDDDHHHINTKELAKTISDNVTRESIAGIKIKLLVCHAANNQNKWSLSFADMFSNALMQNGLTAFEIIAYPDSVALQHIPHINQYHIINIGQLERSHLLNHKYYEIRELLIEYINYLAYVIKPRIEYYNIYWLHGYLSRMDSLASYLETLSQSIKFLNNILPDKKALFIYTDGSLVKHDYTRLKQWDREQTRILYESGMQREAETFSQLSYIHKFGFIKSLRSDHSEHVASTNKLMHRR